MGTETIESQRLVLRQLHTTDATAMFRNWAGDPEVTRYLSWSPHQIEDTVRESLLQRQRNYQRSDFYDWGIVEKETGVLLGTITVVQQLQGGSVVEIGYVLGRSFWGKGFATEALVRVVDYLFATTTVRRIEAFHDRNNPASGRVMQKAGFQFEGILRQRGQNQQGIVDEACYALLREDFLKNS